MSDSLSAPVQRVVNLGIGPLETARALGILERWPLKGEPIFGYPVIGFAAGMEAVASFGS